MGKKTKAHWTAFCEKWNAENPVGTPVTLARDNGQEVHTRTRSRAQVSEAGYPVIWLEGVSGYYLMDRVSVRPAEPGINV